MSNNVLVDELAAKAFTEAFSHSDTLGDVAEHLSCGEVEALADMLEALGAPESAEAWREEHAKTDEDGDLHYLYAG